MLFRHSKQGDRETDERLEAQPAEEGAAAEELPLSDVQDEMEELRELSARLDIPLWTELPVNRMKIDFARRVPIQFLKRHRMAPLETPEGRVIVLRDPAGFQSLDDLRRILKWENGRVALAPVRAIMSAINFAYDHIRRSAEELVQNMDGESAGSILSEIEERGDLLDDAGDAPIIKLVNIILSEAIRDRASDIHLEPYQSSLNVRYRIDGVLYRTIGLPKRIQSPLISRIKIMAHLNIAEKRLPQDGRIEIRIGDRNVDIRVSVIPTAFGERVVLRLLDKTASILKLSDLGMDEGRIKVFDELIKSPYGIILVTGPTGSGKTTTLYAALSSLNSPDVNIITIEDPIEYQIDGIGQIQVNPKIGLTFAAGLRSIVRQDPDIILVGEIRDQETAEIAIQSSLTGHLVFSTLHTNDAASAITRLIDMGIEPFLAVSSLVAIAAQRLVRVLCPSCREPYKPEREQLESLGVNPEMLLDKEVYRKRGCPACLQTGYRGRTGIFELMILEEELKHLILTTSDSNQINRLAMSRGMTTLLEDGARKVLQGITTIEEVLRVTRVMRRKGLDNLE